jgi:hypothetical protein
LPAADLAGVTRAFLLQGYHSRCPSSGLRRGLFMGPCIQARSVSDGIPLHGPGSGPAVESLVRQRCESAVM